jgi:uncharacterized protein (TIGR02597 family)
MTTRAILYFATAIQLAAASTWAQSVGGATTIQIKGGRDNRISIPYQSPPADGGQVAAIAESTVKILDKSWQPDQFAYVAGEQPRTYYAQFADGELAGAFYKIVSNDADTLVLDTGGDDLTAHPLGPVAYGDTVKVIPYWTVADIFGATQGTLIIEPRTSPLFAKDDILLYSEEQVGINKAAAKTLYFRAGVGWRSVADPNTDCADTILPPGEVCVVRRRNAADVSLVNSGLYYRQRRVVFVRGGNGVTGNDQQVALTFPEPLTLDESNLANSAVLPSASPLLRNDELLLWRNSPGFNQPANTTIYFQQGAGWKRVGDATPIGGTFTIEPGEGLVIRKKASNPGVDWLQLPPQ